MATTNILMATYDELGYFDSGLNQDQMEAVEYSLTWAKAATRATLREQNLPLNPNSQAYFDTYLKCLQEVAWNITAQSPKTLDSEGDTLDAPAIMNNLFSGELPQPQLDGLSNMWQALQSSTSSSVEDFMNFWWQNSNDTTPATAFAVSPWYISDSGQVTMALAFYGYTDPISRWRTLFVAQPQAQLVGPVQTFLAELDMDVWNEVKDPIIEQIKSHEAQVVQHQPLVF